jgi:head-tail adaptor
VRATPDTQRVAVTDRVVDARDLSRIFAIRFIENLDMRGRYLLLQCEAGVADG